MYQYSTDPITHTTTGATGIGAATGLPAGVTAAWAANTITISGTPTAAGVFNYSIPLTGGCGTVNATGTITVTPANTVRCGIINTDTVYQHSIDPYYTYHYRSNRNRSSHGITSRSNSSLGSQYYHYQRYAVQPVGIFNYSIPLTGGCGTVNATGTITVTPANTVRCSIINTDVVYQYGTYTDYTYHNRSYRNRHSHGITSRSYSSMGG